MASDRAFKRIQELFFQSPENCQGSAWVANNLTDKELHIKKRWEGIFAYWLENPEATDKTLAGYITVTFDVSRAQAYLDIQYVKELLGNVRSAKKEWYRHVVNQLLLQVIEKEIAKGKESNGQPDYAIVISAVDKLGKYNKLDQEEMDQLPWEDIVPPEWVPTTDVTVLPGMKRIRDLPARMKELKKKYYGESNG